MSCVVAHALLGFSSDELSVFPMVSCYLLNVSMFGWLVMTFVLGVSPLQLWMLWSVLSLVFGFISTCFPSLLFCQWSARVLVASGWDDVLMVHI